MMREFWGSVAIGVTIPISILLITYVAINYDTLIAVTFSIFAGVFVVLLIRIILNWMKQKPTGKDVKPIEEPKEKTAKLFGIMTDDGVYYINYGGLREKENGSGKVITLIRGGNVGTTLDYKDGMTIEFPDKKLKILSASDTSVKFIVEP
jgi:hypothetical protein